MKTTTTNINQKRGPTTGNAGNGAKRSAFTEARAAGSRAVGLAGMVMSALTGRGRGREDFIKSSEEGLSPNTNVGRGPRKGNK